MCLEVPRGHRQETLPAGERPTGGLNSRSESERLLADLSLLHFLGAFAACFVGVVGSVGGGVVGWCDLDQHLLTLGRTEGLVFGRTAEKASDATTIDPRAKSAWNRANDGVRRDGRSAPSEGASLWEHPRDDFTLVNAWPDNRLVAWIRGAVWMPVGSMVELGPPARDAVVVGVRLQLLPGDKAVVLVDVDDPEPGSTIPRSFVDRLAKGT
jgi:hypothetical protein